jgi:RHS repeat-associated protein
VVPNSGYQYKYNGKEWQDELGLNVTAMDFRMYDNALGRFNVIDAVADIMPGWSPYRFGFNNPVIWKDPSGLLENGGGDDDVVKGGTLEEIVITAKRNKPKEKSVHDTGLPYNHSYWMMPKSYNAMSFDDYNAKHGTNYKTFDEWYYKEKYLPFKMEMIRDIQNAQFKAGMAVMALVGSVAAAPILAASPVVTSVLSNPLVQQGALNISLNAGSQYLANGGNAGDINMIEAGLSGVPGTNLTPTIAGETFSFTANNYKQGITLPSSLGKWGAQMGGGVLSNRFGKATDSYLGSEGLAGKAVGDYFKFIVETGSNAAPNAIND